MALLDANHKLEEARKELTALNQIKDRIFSVISHDLKSPMASLAMFMDMLVVEAESFTADELKQISKDIQQAMNETANLLGNLLQWF